MSPAGSSNSIAAAAFPIEGNYSGWLEQKQKRLAQEGKQEAARQRTLERELEWVRQSPRARQAKSKARISAPTRAWSRKSREKAPETAQIVLPPGPRARRSRRSRPSTSPRPTATSC